MLVIPGAHDQATCDGMTRRELLRVGGSAILGLSLADLFAHKSQANQPSANRGPGWNRAQHVIIIYLQGGPSHLDLWDPKPEAPDRVRSIFRPINTRVAGIQYGELLPNLARVNDKFTMIRTMSYTPIGLFNHTAAIYQMMTGYQADAVSPSGQLEPPTPRDYPHFGSQVTRLKPPTQPTLPFVMMPRPLQESNVVNKGGTAGFLGRAYDPYYLFPPGDDMDLNKMNRISVDDLQLRPEVPASRLERRGRLRDQISEGMPELEQAVSRYDLPQYYSQALNLVLSGRARNAFTLSQESTQMRERYGMNTFGQCCLLARRLIESGTRIVQINWPKVANSDNHSWDVHQGLPDRMRRQAAPMLDAGLSTLIGDLDDRGLLNETLVVCVGEFGRSPIRGVSTSGNSNSADGRDHWPYCYTGVVAGAGVRRGHMHGRSDATGSAPLDNPVHPRDLLATIYHSLGINPHTIAYNHLNQPRELVQGDVVGGILQ
ncbi:MAG: DUF1501 domain-containing protein [Planctomycetes bacterium]|nr:DUF1501 domain-containing protein [Planctomycetota bacterium]